MNLYLFEYSLKSLKRRGSKNIFIFIIFFILIFLLSSTFFISNSIQKELSITQDELPDITIQRLQGGREQNIDINMIDEIAKIDGISKIVPRVWGYYYFKQSGANFVLVGLNRFYGNYKDSLEKITDKLDKTFFEKKDMMIVGKGVKNILKNSFYDIYYNFVLPDGSLKKVQIAGIFKKGTELESNDIILMNANLVRKIFGMKKDEITDITLNIANPKEVDTIAEKLRFKYPNYRIITKEDLKISYANIFDYKSGVFLALFITSLFTFFIIIYDKASGLSSDERREIGIQKALGWKINDILTQKFYESFIISFLAYFSAVSFAIFYVFILQAPLLKNIFTGYSVLKPDFNLIFDLDFSTLALIFFLTIPIYIGATIIPSWYSATLEADEVIR